MRAAENGRYRRGDGEVFRRSSRDTVDGDRPSRAAITRMLSSRHRPSAISSRSASDSLTPATAPLRFPARDPGTLIIPG